MVVIELQKDEKIEEMLESLQDHFKELQDEASDLRKRGIDTGIVDIMMIDFMPRVKMVRATYDPNDLDAVKGLLAKIRHELDMIKSGTEFDAALIKIQNAYDLIRQGKKKEAEDIYKQLRPIYSKLSGELKQIVYKASLDIHKRLVS